MGRVMIVGPPGSGKSTLARRVGAACGVLVFHLDQAFWRAGWVQAPKEAFRAEVARMVAEPSWVIEGNYLATIGLLLARADTVVVLEMGRVRCLWRVVRRLARHRGRVRADMADGCVERLDLTFLRFVWCWNRANRPGLLRALESRGGRLVVVRGPGDAERLVRGFAGPGCVAGPPGV